MHTFIELIWVMPELGMRKAFIDYKKILMLSSNNHTTKIFFDKQEDEIEVNESPEEILNLIAQKEFSNSQCINKMEVARQIAKDMGFQ